MGLADGEVLVVARVGDERVLLGARGARQVEAGVVVLGEAVVGPRRAGRPREQVDLVGCVELRRQVGAEPVERVEVEARRPPLDQVDDRHGGVVPQLALVEGQVVVDELAEVGEPRRDLAVLRVARLRHRGGDLAPVGLAELAAVALGSLAREAEGPEVDLHRRRGGRRPPGRRRSRPSPRRRRSTRDASVAPWLPLRSGQGALSVSRARDPINPPAALPAASGPLSCRLHGDPRGLRRLRRLGARARAGRRAGARAPAAARGPRRAGDAARPARPAPVRDRRRQHAADRAVPRAPRDHGPSSPTRGPSWRGRA